MHRFGFSLLALLGVVTIAAIGCAALANATEAWAVLIVSSAFSLLAFGVLSSINGKGHRRAFWLGFVAVGLGYDAMLFCDTPYGRPDDSF
jgi:hypothetical protein